MQYPLYVRQTDDMRYRGDFPDFPRASASGKSIEELQRNARDRVQRIYDRSEHPIPVPTDDLCALQRREMDDGNGIWMFVEIDLALITSRAVHFHLSLDVDALRDIDDAAQERRITRKEFIALACLHELDCARADSALAPFGFGAKVTGLT